VVTKRRLNIALAVLAVVVVVAVFIAARAGGSQSSTGNASACNAYWTWYDDSTGNGQGTSTAVYDAYKDATTQPLINDLHALAEGLQGNTDVNTNNASNDIANICTGDGYADPAS
jgi:hypothetical protein